MLFAVLDAETVAQLTVNGIFRGAAYGILGVGFAIILGVTGRFHFAYAFTYTLAAYMVFTFKERWSVPFWVAAVLGIVAVGFVGVGIERFIYRPLAVRARETALLAIFVASLGIAIAGENIIRLLWSSSSQNLLGPDQVAYTLAQGQLPELRRVAGGVELRPRRRPRTSAALHVARSVDQGHAGQP